MPGERKDPQANNWCIMNVLQRGQILIDNNVVNSNTEQQ